jgi:CRP-like cAMP-binding protein
VVAKRKHKKKQMSAGNLSTKLDRDLLHQYLWQRVDRLGRVTIRQKDLAEGLGVTDATMSLLFKEMVLAGRLRKVRTTFYVVDPKLWAWRNTNPEPLERT